MNHKYVLFITCVLAMLCQTLSKAEAQTSGAWDHAIRFPAGSTGQLMVHEGYAYVLNGWSRADGILIFDVKDPAKPRFVRGLPAPGYLSGAAKALAYAGALTDGVKLGGAYLATRVLVAGPYAYFIDQLYGLRVADISSPSQPKLAGEGVALIRSK